MKKISILFIALLLATGAAQAQNVTVVYNGNTATVNMDSIASQYLTVTQSGAHVSVAQSDSLATEITYNLSGTSADGEFYMSGSYKATLELDGLTLTNATPVYSGAAVHIQNSKRIKVKVVTGTINSLTDAATGSQKGCLYIKGHAEFAQQGTLNIVGNVKHGIKTGEYISLKNATLHVTSAVGDGISCNEYFLMQSGSVTISGTGDDGIQCDLDGETPTGETADHEDEDSGNIYIEGGTLNITCTAIAAKGIKCVGDMKISGGDLTVTTSGKGMWDTDDLETKAACCLSADGNMEISGGTLDLTSTGSGGYIYSRSTNNDGMDANGNLYINGGLVYAIGARSPELALDANSEEQKRIYINGGVIIAVNGIENGSSINQPYIQSSSVGSNSWYTVTYGDNAVAFYTPTVNTGGGPGGHGGGPGGSGSSSTFISAPSTPSLANGNSISDGTAHFEGNCYVSGNSGDDTGINGLDMEGITIRSLNGNITVEGCEGCTVSIFNMEGRRVGSHGLSTGVYLVKVGDYPTRKIVVTR